MRSHSVNLFSFPIPRNIRTHHHCRLRITLLQWNPAITKCHGTEKSVRYSEDPIITNHLVNNKNIRYSGVTKMNQAEQWDL